MARGQTTANADAAKVSAWSTGGGSGTAKPTDPDGKPAAAAASPAAAYWQAPPLPAAVIQGGTIPPGWQPQAIPYQGVGPDGRVITQYFAPTYTFTYQVGPPVLAVPQPAAVNRRQMPVYRSPQPYGVAPAPYAGGLNSQAPAVPPVTAQAPPQTVARYAPPPIPQPVMQPAAPPAGWMPSTAPPPAITAPTTPPAGWAAAALPAAGVVAAAATPPPTAAIAPVPAPADATPAMQPVTAPPPTVTVSRSRLWRVVGVQDGDTVTCLDDLNQQRKIDLADVDAPEISQDYGKASREALAGMVFGRTVEAVDGAATASGSQTARLFVDGLDVSRQMVATGNAWPDPSSQDRSLGTDQAQAKAATLGLWAEPAPVPPWEYRTQGRP
jgi:endonuclease YncB( thermonuclease family)